MMAYRQEGTHTHTHTLREKQEAMPSACISHDPPVMRLTKETSVLSSWSIKTLLNEQLMGYES